MITISKGLDLPIKGTPLPTIYDGATVRHVALLGEEFPGLRPSLLVKVGDAVQKGQALFSNKKNPGVLFTAPAAGRVEAIHRGPQRVFESLVIACDESLGAVSFPRHESTALSQLPRERVQQQLVDSGLWTALRTRP